jgi:hypothetical protein
VVRPPCVGLFLVRKGELSEKRYVKRIKVSQVPGRKGGIFLTRMVKEKKENNKNRRKVALTSVPDPDP